MKHLIPQTETKLDLLSNQITCLGNQTGYLATIKNFRNASTQKVEDAVERLKQDKSDKVSEWYQEYLFWLKLKGRIEETKTLAKYF